MVRTGSDGGLTAPAKILRDMVRGWRLRAAFACGVTLVLATACDTSGFQGGFGRAATERLETVEATQEFRIAQTSRAFVNAPHALLVLERNLGSVVEQRIALSNTTTLAGENALYLRAQLSGSASTNRMILSEILPRFGGAPAPFSSVSEGDLMVGEDRYGSFVYASRRLAEGLVCVLALRRTDTGARPLPRGSVGLDMMLRNCVEGDVRQALLPIGEGAFGLGSPAY